jgi:hypothetical protein
MATLQNSYQPQSFRVIHPLDDAMEQKCTSEGLGHIEMTGPVRLSLKILRGYLLVMSALLVYHVLDLAGILRHLK